MPAVIPIICEGCGKRIEIARELLDQPLVCSECDTPVEVESYPPLVKARDELVADRRAKEAAQEEERRRQRERERAAAAAAQASLRAAQEAEREAKRAREEEWRRRQEAEEARIKAGREEADRQRRMRQRAELTVGVFGAVTICVLFCIMALCIAAFSMFAFFQAKSIMHEIFGALGVLVAAALGLGGMIYLQIALMARAVVEKLNAVRDLQEVQISSLTKLTDILARSTEHPKK